MPSVALLDVVPLNVVAPLIAMKVVKSFEKFFLKVSKVI
jgi:hypothetical protein